MKMINRKILPYCVLLALSFFLGYSIVKVDSPFSSFSYFKEENRLMLLQNTKKYSSKNPDLYFKLANLNDILLASSQDELTSLYLDTVKNNPLHVFSLLKLADISIDNGNEPDALEIIKTAEKYSRMSAERLWELSFVAYKLKQYDLFYKSLNTVAEIDDNRKDYVYQLVLKLVDDRKQILELIINESVFEHYFGYIMRESDYENVQISYNHALDNGYRLSSSTMINYLDYLINNGKGEPARDIWESMYGNSDENMWNGGFENEILNKGLGWKVDDIYDINYETKTEFETSRPLRGERSLKIKFLNKNVDYRNVSQSVIVKPGTRYLFSSLLATRDITSNNGIGWEINCNDLYVQTDYLTGNNEEKVVFANFLTPDNCNILRISLRRKKSEKFNRYISGEVLVDEVFLREIDSVR